MSLMKKIMETAVRFVPDRPVDPLLNEPGWVGQPVTRADGSQKVTGGATFAAEYQLHNLAYAAVCHSTIAKGSVTGIDISEAEKLPGVVAILSHLNAPKMAAPPGMDATGGSGGASASPLPIFQDDRVHWSGQAVALVVAETQDQAEEAAARIRVEYQTDAADLSFEKLKDRAKPPANLMGEPSELKLGEPEAALARAEAVVDQIYRTPGHYHTALEPHASIAAWSDDLESLTVFEASQMIYGFRNTLAKVFSLAKEKVRVVSPFVGGGFGSKGLWSNSILCALAARQTGRPVKLALPRESVFRLVGGRTQSEQRVAIGASPEGHFQVLVHTGTTATTSHNNFAEPFSLTARHLYASDNLWVAQKILHLDTVANTFMRAPGEAIGGYALECAVDELAHQLGLDPIELRHRNEPTKDPTKGTEFSQRALLLAYRQGAEAFGWEHKAPRSRRQGDWWIGQGVATACFPYDRMPCSAKIRISRDGWAVVSTSAHEMGMGTATVQIQHAAQRLGLPMEQVTFDYGDSELPEASMAGGSSQTASLVAAVAAVVEKLHLQLLKLCSQESPLHGRTLGELEARDGGLFPKEGDSRGETYVSILSQADKPFLEVEATSGAPLEMLKYSMHSTGAQFAELKVHEITGEIRLTRLLGSFECGRLLNPKTAHSQLRGGMIMGIGMALTEEALFDTRHGRVLNASLGEYHVPVQLDVPEIQILTTGIPDPHAPMGLRGIGEIGITGVAAAIANAVFNATGKRIRDLPITLDKLF